MKPFIPTIDQEIKKEINTVGFAMILITSKNIGSHLSSFFPHLGIFSFEGEFVFLGLAVALTMIIAISKMKKDRTKVRWMFNSSWPFWMGVIFLLVNGVLLAIRSGGTMLSKS